jgi:hypothetical protein
MWPECLGKGTHGSAGMLAAGPGLFLVLLLQSAFSCPVRDEPSPWQNQGRFGPRAPERGWRVPTPGWKGSCVRPMGVSSSPRVKVESTEDGQLCFFLCLSFPPLQNPAYTILSPDLGSYEKHCPPVRLSCSPGRIWLLFHLDEQN